MDRKNTNFPDGAMYTRKLLFPVCVNNIPVGFCGQENEGQVWWHGIFVTKAHRQGNSKNPQEKKTDGQINISLSFYPWRLFPVGVHTGKLFFNFPVSILYFPVGMCTLREIPVSSSVFVYTLQLTMLI